MELIYVNDQFSNLQMAFFQKHNVILPELNSLYLPRDIFKINGKTAIHLQEIVNDKIRGEDGFSFEPSWNLNRFRKLNGDSVTFSEINKVLKRKTIKL